MRATKWKAAAAGADLRKARAQMRALRELLASEKERAADLARSLYAEHEQKCRWRAVARALAEHVDGQEVLR